jgi:hypothetical protein
MVKIVKNLVLKFKNDQNYCFLPLLLFYCKKLFQTCSQCLQKLLEKINPAIIARKFFNFSSDAFRKDENKLKIKVRKKLSCKKLQEIHEME